MFDAFNVVKEAPEPLNNVAANSPVFELKVKFVPDLAPKSPVAAVVNKTLQDIKDLQGESHRQFKMC